MIEWIHTQLKRARPRPAAPPPRRRASAHEDVAATLARDGRATKSSSDPVRPAVYDVMRRVAWSQGLCAAVPRPRPLSLFIYRYVEDAVDTRAPHRSAHLALASSAAARGALLLGGAFADPVDGGVLVFRSAIDAEAFAAADPYVHAGVVRSWRVREWSAVAGSLYDHL